jgi:hypothetical protein
MRADLVVDSSRALGGVPLFRDILGAINTPDVAELFRDLK